MRGFFARLVDPRTLKPVKGVDYHDGYTPQKGIDYRDGTDATLPYQSGKINGLRVDVSSFASGNVRRTVDAAGVKKGDVVSWSFADGASVPTQVSPAGAFSPQDGKITFCFTVAGLLGVSLGSVGSVSINAVWMR